MNEIDKKALRNQRWSTDYVNDLAEIKKYCMKYDGSYLGCALSCFNYGVMVGKRQERKKLTRIKSRNDKARTTLIKIMQYVKSL